MRVRCHRAAWVVVCSLWACEGTSDAVPGAPDAQAASPDAGAGGAGAAPVPDAGLTEETLPLTAGEALRWLEPAPVWPVADFEVGRGCEGIVLPPAGPALEPIALPPPARVELRLVAEGVPVTMPATVMLVGRGPLADWAGPPWRPGRVFPSPAEPTPEGARWQQTIQPGRYDVFVRPNLGLDVTGGAGGWLRVAEALPLADGAVVDLTVPMRVLDVEVETPGGIQAALRLGWLVGTADAIETRSDGALDAPGTFTFRSPPARGLLTYAGASGVGAPVIGDVLIDPVDLVAGDTAMSATVALSTLELEVDTSALPGRLQDASLEIMRDLGRPGGTDGATATHVVLDESLRATVQMGAPGPVHLSLSGTLVDEGGDSRPVHLSWRSVPLRPGTHARLAPETATLTGRLVGLTPADLADPGLRVFLRQGSEDHAITRAPGADVFTFEGFPGEYTLEVDWNGRPAAEQADRLHFQLVSDAEAAFDLRPGRILAEPPLPAGAALTVDARAWAPAETGEGWAIAPGTYQIAWNAGGGDSARRSVADWRVTLGPGETVTLHPDSTVSEALVGLAAGAAAVPMSVEVRGLQSGAASGSGVVVDAGSVEAMLPVGAGPQRLAVRAVGAVPPGSGFTDQAVNAMVFGCDAGED